MKDFGILMLRIGIGIMFILHGLPKIAGGPVKWAKVGTAMEHIGVYFLPEFWGFMAGCSEFFGGILILLGLWFIPANAFLFITMSVASIKHISQGDSFNEYSHSVEAAILFLSLIFIGAGKYTIIKLIKPDK